jgi:hypothetical protein
MSQQGDYVPPKVWTWTKPNGGTFANINRPTAGSTHEQKLPVGSPAATLFVGDAQRREGHDPARRVAAIWLLRS